MHFPESKDNPPGSCMAWATGSQARVEGKMGVEVNLSGNSYSEHANSLTSSACAHMLMCTCSAECIRKARGRRGERRRIGRGRHARHGKRSTKPLLWKRMNRVATILQRKENQWMTGRDAKTRKTPPRKSQEGLRRVHGE